MTPTKTLITMVIIMVIGFSHVTGQEPGKYHVYYDAGFACNHFLNQRVEGDTADLVIADDWSENPCAGLFSIRLDYTPGGMTGYASMLRNHQNGSDSDTSGVNLNGAVMLRVGARGETGNERIELFMRDGTGMEITSGELPLTRFWTFYELDLTGVDLNSVKEGLGVRFRQSVSPSGAVVYLDDVTYEFEDTRFIMESNATEYGPGDRFELSRHIVGPEPETETIRDLYVLLEIGGSYWFWPDWSAVPGFQTIKIKDSLGCRSLLEFSWPELVQAIDGICFWGALLDSVTMEITGDIQRVCISYTGAQGT